MQGLSKGRYRVRMARTTDDLAAAQGLRHWCFFGLEGCDSDPFDELCQHYLIEEADTARLVGCFRVMPLANGGEIGRSYSAQFYDLAALAGFAAPLAEVGRFCMLAGNDDSDLLRLAWAALTRYVDENAVEMLFGCSSFAGIDPQEYTDSFCQLHAHHLAPVRYAPAIKAVEVLRFAQLPAGVADSRRALRLMPSLLRSYLAMGGWVSDHAVIDRGMNTMHVFTGLEVDAIPEGRKRLLRADAV